MQKIPRAARPAGSFGKDGVGDGTRTHDNRNHNPGLYQLSYTHHPEQQKSNGVGDGTRTHDNRNHNPGLYQLSYTHHQIFVPVSLGLPGRIRTSDPRLRRPMLYPTELRAETSTCGQT